MNIPTPVQETMDKEWADIKPEFDALLAQEVTEDTIEQWLKTWTKLADRIEEASSRLAVLHTLDTADAEAERRYFRFAEDVMPEVNKVYQALNKKLVESGLIPPGMEVPLRDIRTSIEIFREQNLPLFVEHQRLGSNYSKIVAAQTVEWDGDEKTLLQMQKVLMDDDRPTREKAWQAIHNRWLEDRAAINENWVKLMDIRKQMAENAGFSDYRTYRWQQLNRHDYTPDDCYRFHEAIEKMAVPAAAKLQERHRQRLGLNILRPWDLDVDSLGDEPLRPFESIKDFEEKGNNILERVSPQFGAYFQTMRDEKLLDLDNRKGKAPGG
ncbi:MAG: M3 family metallopeptidase, partial [Chloroflexi bacterium]|nr:M3 family metallopeptidase [Chloroflexota bacterium]